MSVRRVERPAGVTLSIPEQNSNTNALISNEVSYSNTLYGLVVPFDSHIEISQLCFIIFREKGKKNNFLFPEQNSHTTSIQNFVRICLK